MIQTAADSGHSGLKAPLFGSLISQLAKDQRWVVLDLGSANGEIINLLSKYRCSLDIADLPATLATLRQLDEPELLQALVEKLLPRRDDEKADIVLCWDLLNYLDKPAISTLMTAVAGRAKPGAMVHSLITFSSIHMPAEPCRYGVIDSQHLLQYKTGNAERHAPQYSPKVLWECMPGYDLEKAMLLRNGMQEYLFRVMKPGELARNTAKAQQVEVEESDLANLNQFM
ncbi:MAG: class I SAM-dependent methyltransferase [Nevskiales bacterium]